MYPPPVRPVSTSTVTGWPSRSTWTVPPLTAEEGTAMQPSLRPVKISTVTFMPLWRAWVSVRLISTV